MTGCQVTFTNFMQVIDCKVSCQQVGVVMVTSTILWKQKLWIVQEQDTNKSSKSYFSNSY